MIRQMLVEMIGAYIITFTISFCRINNPDDYLSIGLTYFFVMASLTYTFKNVSGAHFNPVLTASLIFSRQATFKKAALYIIMQLLGSVLAAATVFALYPQPADVENFMYGLPTMRDNEKLIGSFLEFMAMFLLVYVYSSIICNVAAPKHIYGAAIACIYSASLFTINSFSGGCINVVTLVGPAIFSNHYDDMGYYISAQFLGGVLAATIYGLFLNKGVSEVEDEDAEEESIVDKTKAI